MGYEQIDVYAIQDLSIKSFDHRFKTFNNKADRDKQYIFLRDNLTPVDFAKRIPVKMRVTVITDNIEQLGLYLGDEN